jgi:hypothetical protein
MQAGQKNEGRVAHCNLYYGPRHESGRHVVADFWFFPGQAAPARAACAAASRAIGTRKGEQLT